MTSTKFLTGKDAKLKSDIYFFECKRNYGWVEFIFQFKMLILWVDFRTSNDKMVYFEMYICHCVLMEIMCPIP
jgi:hypothetical protein